MYITEKYKNILTRNLGNFHIIKITKFLVRSRGDQVYY